MTPHTVSGILDSQALKFLAGCRGPCITVVVPAHHPGAQEGSRRALVHSLIRNCSEQVTRGKMAGSAAELLGPLEEIAEESGIQAGGSGFAIFRSPDARVRYDLPDRPRQKPLEKRVVADHFYLLPFADDALSLHEFFGLGLRKQHLRLFR